MSGFYLIKYDQRLDGTCTYAAHVEMQQLHPVHDILCPLLHFVICHDKFGPPVFVPPGPNISKYLDPQSIYFRNIRTPLKYLDPLTK